MRVRLKNNVNNKKQISRALLSNKGRFSVCSNCSAECDPMTCCELTEWVIEK